MLQADTIFACLCYSTKSAYVVSLSLHKKLAKEGFRCHFLSLLPPHLLCIPRGISSNSYLLLRFRFLGIYSRKNVTFIFAVLEKMRFLEVNVHKHHNLAHCLREEWFI